jgi:hypothetical protein
MWRFCQQAIFQELLSPNLSFFPWIYCPNFDGAVAHHGALDRMLISADFDSYLELTRNLLFFDNLTRGRFDCPERTFL